MPSLIISMAVGETFNGVLRLPWVLPDRTIAGRVGEWKNYLLAACRGGQFSAGRYDAYCRNIDVFVAWAGPSTAMSSRMQKKCWWCGP